MKTITKNLIKVLTILLLSSCTIGEEKWHESARMIGAKSIYVNKDGTRTTGEEWYANHPERDKKFKEKYGTPYSKSSPTFIGVE